MFVQNQKRVYRKMDGVRIINNEKANADESKQCWSNIWDNKKEHESECCMVKGIKSRKRQHETDWYRNIDWDDNKTGQKDPTLENPRTRWSSGLLAEDINSITWVYSKTNGWYH